MVLLGDYHTHTTFSHGKGSIEDNVKIAIEKNLKEVAITDHGFNHKLYGVKRNKLQTMREEVDRLNKIYPIKILLGLETNLISANGDIDLKKDEEELLDVVLMGFHKIIKPLTLKDKITFFDKNKLLKYLGYTKSSIQKHTDAYLRAIDKNDIDVLTHLNYGMPVDCIQIAKLANQKGVLIELNGKRTIFTQEEVDKMVEMKTKFIINSDAHKPHNVGECNLPTNFALINKIPDSLIINYNNLPEFKKHRKI